MAIRFSLAILVIMYIFHLGFCTNIPLVCTHTRMCRAENDSGKIWRFFYIFWGGGGGRGPVHALAVTNQVLHDAKKLNTVKPDPVSNELIALNKGDFLNV